MKLKREDFVPHALEYAGKTRVNHESPDCTGSSKSMVVERKDDGSISAKCFRCGATGYVGKKEYKPSFARSPFGIKKKQSGKVPTDVTYKWDEFSTHAIVYLNKFGFTEADTTASGIGFSKKINRLVIPVKNLTRTHAGWIGKSFDDGYRYYTNSKEPEFMYQHHHTSTTDVLIVEDSLSALKASKVLSTFALLGTELSTTMKQELIATGYQKFFLWLDNDNTVVKMKQLKIANELSLFGEVKLITLEREPKECSEVEITGILYYI